MDNGIGPEITSLLNAHKEAIFFKKATGSWPGGDVRELGRIAKAMGMPEHEINYNCSGCLSNMIEFIFNQIPTRKEIRALKDTWFEEGTLVKLIDDYRPNMDAGLFEGIRTSQSEISESHPAGYRYIDQEMCDWDEFEIKEIDEYQEFKQRKGI